MVNRFLVPTDSDQPIRGLCYNKERITKWTILKLGQKIFFVIRSFLMHVFLYPPPFFLVTVHHLPFYYILGFQFMDMKFITRSDRKDHHGFWLLWIVLPSIHSVFNKMNCWGGGGVRWFESMGHTSIYGLKYICDLSCRTLRQFYLWLLRYVGSLTPVNRFLKIVDTNVFKIFLSRKHHYFK